MALEKIKICIILWLKNEHRWVGRGSNFSKISASCCGYLRKLQFNISQATREEAEIRLAEMKKSSYEFNRDIVLGAKNPVTLLMHFNISYFSHVKLLD